MEFTQEVIGAESYLVYHLQKEETVDSFLKGMLQNNEIQGILKPSFSQKDMERYIRYSVTSKIPLSEWMVRSLKKEKVLALFASIISAIEDAEEYMITVDKLLMDPVHIYIDVSSMKAFFICLPLEDYGQENYGQEKQSTDLLKEILFSCTYEEWEDLNYVGQIIDYLNKNKNGSMKKFLQFLKDLSGTKDMSAASVQPQKTPEVSALVQPQKTSAVSVPASLQKASAVSMPAPPQKTLHSPYQEIVPSVQAAESPLDESVMKKKFSLFGNGKEQKQTSHPNNICVPGMDIPGMDRPDGSLHERPELADGLAGQSVEEESKRKKKKGRSGLFRGKKKEDPVLPEPPIPSFSTTVYGYGGSEHSVPPSTGYPVRSINIDMVMAGSGENMDNEEGTIIMGGGMEEEKTQFLNSVSEDSRGKEDMSHMVATLTRRRNNQRIALTKPVVHIGKESSFADFYIGDNPAISSAHADIVLTNGIYYIRDMNSLNHTYVNQTMVMPNRLVPLHSGDVIKLANEDFDFVIGS